MSKVLKSLVWLGVAILVAALAYGYGGYRDARSDGLQLAARADALVAAGRGGIDLGTARLAILLAVEDPAFYIHAGFDLTTDGAGATTITQSLAKTAGFADFSPGLQKLRQTGYAIGLERELTKPQILALFLDTVPMGRGPDGEWVDGAFAASRAHFDAAPDQTTQEEFVRLVAVMIAPGQLSLATPDDTLAMRIARIDRLIAQRCQPYGHRDVWLMGCAVETDS